MKTALIIGILGQDGSYLAELLVKKGYKIYGIVKENTSLNRIQWIQSLIPNVSILEANILDTQALRNIINSIKPNVIYNFAGVSNIFNPWENLEATFLLNAKLPQDILEILKDYKSIKYFQASSCLIFGKDTSGFQNENTTPNPVLPYGAAKLYADNMIKEFRDTFGLFCCSGIFFNHESPRRGAGFFSKKVTTAVKNIKAGLETELVVGDLSDIKDYGYAPDFMEAVYLMMNQAIPKDYIIGTGKLISTQKFVEKCFDTIGLDYKNYIKIDSNLKRKNKINILRADANKINNDLGWYPKHTVDDMISIMVKG